MFVFKLMSCIQGYLVILVTGEAPEKFVNMAASRGIYLWDVARTGSGAILLKVRLEDAKPLRHIARRTGCRFKIKQRVGLPFYFVRLRRRKALALGMVFFVAALYLLSSFVWFIEVKGSEHLSPEMVLRVASDAGLSRGTAKWKIDPGKVEEKIIEGLPEVSYAGVYLKGTKATIEVAERTVPDQEDPRPAHIVSTKAGLIKEILIFSGYPAVKEGDTVVSGQVLISGVIPAPEEAPKDGEGKKPGVPEIIQPSRYVQAKGIVRARVWYEGYGEAEIIETGTRFTGNVKTRVSIKSKDKEIILSGSRNIPFALYENDVHVKTIPEWRNINIPVELITVKYLELTEYRDERGRAGALKLAEERALHAAGKSVPEEAAIQERWVEEALTGQPDNLMRAKAVIETVEDIGKKQFFSPQ